MECIVARIGALILRRVFPVYRGNCSWRFRLHFSNGVARDSVNERARFAIHKVGVRSSSLEGVHFGHGALKYKSPNRKDSTCRKKCSSHTKQLGSSTITLVRLLGCPKLGCIPEPCSGYTECVSGVSGLWCMQPPRIVHVHICHPKRI
jgi:hypothetical protein